MTQDTPTTVDACPCCSSSELEPIYSIDRIPVHSCILAHTAEQALSVPFGSLSLSVCLGCGFVFNTRYDSSLQDYTPAYEEQQSFSPTFNAFADALVDRLLAHYNLRGRTALEIGCGKGDFLALLASRGGMHCIGIDPSADWKRLDPAIRTQISIVQEYFGPQHVDTNSDFLCCRHTLEHIGDTSSFLALVRDACKERPDLPVFFEVPDAMRVFEDGAFWDVYYEHCSYFTPGSLNRFFKNNGFAATQLLREYDDQYLTIEGYFGDGPTRSFDIEESVAETLAAARRYSKNSAQRIEQLRSEVNSLSSRGASVAIWGSGSKCVALLFSLGIADAVERIIDINPHRHGKFAPGLSSPIAAPADLRDQHLDQLIIMNSIYRREIESMLEELNCRVDSIVAL